MKTPWTTNGRWIFDADDKMIGVIPGDGKAKAALIVKAVNHHEEMVELLEVVGNFNSISTDHWEEVGFAAEKARALLARIKGN